MQHTTHEQPDQEELNNHTTKRNWTTIKWTKCPSQIQSNKINKLEAILVNKTIQKLNQHHIHSPKRGMYKFGIVIQQKLLLLEQVRA